MQLRYIAITLILAAALISSHTGAGAASFISIIPSEACRASPNCPSISALAAKYDTSDRKKSGDFVLKKGEWVREKPQLKNHWLFYQNQTVFIDPDREVLKRSKQIVIEPPVHMWYKLEKDKKITNNTFTDYHNRFIDSCSFARIAYDPFLLNDTVNYLKSDCKVKSEYDEKKVTKKPYTKQDISTSYKWKDAKWREQVIKECTKARNACQDLVQPTRAGLK